MKVVTYSSSSHHDMATKYLGRSALVHGFDLIIQNGLQHGDGVFGNAHWTKSLRDKARNYLAAARMLKGEVVLFADADVLICRSFDGYSILGDYDLVAQRDRNTICSGLYVARVTSEFISYLTMIAESDQFYRTKRVLGDQLAMNKLSSNLKRIRLEDPAIFWTPGYSGGRWSRVQDVESVSIPNDILTAHANWIVGLENKQKMLDRIVAHHQLW